MRRRLEYGPGRRAASLGRGGIVAACLAAFGACAHDPPLAPRAVAIMPIETLGMPAEEGVTIESRVESELSSTKAHRVVDATTLRDTLAARAEADSPCLDDDDCLFTVGTEVEADLILAIKLARLGETHVLRARLLEVDPHLVAQDLEETVVGGPRALDAHLPDLLRRIFGSEADPWYGRWWIWAAAGVVVAGAVTTTVVLLARDDRRDAGVTHLGDL